MKIHNNPTRDKWKEICKRPEIDYKSMENTISIVFDEIKSMGDRAVKKNTRQFDQVELDFIQVSEIEFQEADKKVSRQLKNAIDIAKNNIEKFHASQKEEVKFIDTIPGVTCWRESRAIDKVGLYIPGGTAPLFSTVLMLGIPAKLAGCKEIIICTPPQKDGSIHPAILYTAALIGIKKVFKVGGIQAIAAMTFGTETIPNVYKIFGPGNSYVTAAKQYALRKGISIDMPAGPSEVLVMADDSADADFIAADLLSQAEHGSDSQVVLVTDSEKLISKVNEAISDQINELPRAHIAKSALDNSKCILISEQKDAIDFINEYAPEHLILSVKDEGEFIDEINNAGSVFIGALTPESAGDYASGTNHTLPTAGFAKAYSGVSLDSFLKKITYQRISPKGLQSLGPSIEIMADAEGLEAHKQAISIRLKKLYKS